MLVPRASIRSDIAGTVESIAEITPEMLYDSCKAFYAPGNMVLAAAGDTTMEQILAACERHGLMRPRSTERVQRLWKPELLTPRRVRADPENAGVQTPASAWASRRSRCPRTICALKRCMI